MPISKLILQPRPFVAFAGSSGNDVNIKLTVDASLVEAIFYIEAPSNERWLVNKMIVEVRDTKDMDAEAFGDIALGLTDGITMAVLDSEGRVKYPLISAVHPVKQNSGWASYTSNVSVKNWATVAKDVFTVDWNFTESFGAPIALNPGERIAITVSDDLSAIDEVYVNFQGLSLAFAD